MRRRLVSLAAWTNVRWTGGRAGAHFLVAAAPRELHFKWLVAAVGLNGGQSNGPRR